MKSKTVKLKINYRTGKKFGMYALIDREDLDLFTKSNGKQRSVSWKLQVWFEGKYRSVAEVIAYRHDHEARERDVANGLVINHIDFLDCNCTKNNLEIMTTQESSQYRNSYGTKHKNVYYNKKKHNYWVKVTASGKSHSIYGIKSLDYACLCAASMLLYYQHAPYHLLIADVVPRSREDLIMGRSPVEAKERRKKALLKRPGRKFKRH